MGSAFLNMQNEISSLRQKCLLFTILRAKIVSKWLFFTHKMVKSKNFCLKLEISFCMFGKVEFNVITYFSYDIVTWNHVFGCTTTYELKILLFQKLILPMRLQKELICWPKGQHMLTKKFIYQSIHSQLPVAIFIASETHLGAQKCFIYQKKSKNYETHARVLPC